MPAADHGEGVGAGKEARAGDGGDGLLAGVDEIGINVILGGKRSETENAVLGLEDHFHARRDVVRNERRHPDAEVDVIAVAKLLRGAFHDLIAG